MLLSVAFTNATGSPASDIEQQLRAGMPGDGNEYLITIPAFASSLPSVYDSLKVEPLGDARPLGSCWVKVYFFKDNGIFQTANLNLQINLFQKVLVARESIKQGQDLTPELFDVARREVTSLADPPIVSPRELDGKSATRAMAAGKTLTQSFMQKQEIVKRGDMVSIEYVSGSIKITASGEAKESGCQGETIKVKNMSSSKIISAVVQDDKTVKINK
jgi:flagellar basal body P-ring formation protein FlgA